MTRLGHHDAFHFVSAVAPRFVPKYVPKRVEATEILELRKHGLHDTPVLLLNTAGFYDGLTLQLQRMGLHRVLTGLDRNSIEMREVSPMGGLLSDDERMRALQSSK